MKCTFKRFLALALALVMTLGMLPNLGHVHVHAEELENTAPSTEAPTEVDPSEAYAAIQKWIDEILNWYVGSTAATQEEIAAALAALTSDDLWMAQVEVYDLEAEMEATMTEAEINVLLENNEVFLNYVDELFTYNVGPNLLLTVDDLSDSTIGLTAKQSAGVTASGNSITITAEATKFYSFYLAYNNTITIKNNKTTEAVLSFHYNVHTVSADTSMTIDDTEYTAAAEGDFTKTLAAGESIQIKAATKNTKGSKIVLDITNLSLVADTQPTVTYKAPSGGSYTVNGTAITADTPMTNPSTVEYVMVATPASGYKLVGWYNETKGSYDSLEATYTAKFDTNCTIYPVFVTSDTALFEVNGVKFTDLDDAVNYATANGKKQVTLVESGKVFDASYTIPEGITLLVPMDTNYTPMGTSAEYSDSATTPTAFLTLTLNKDTKITVNGNIEVEAKHSCLDGAGGIRPYGGRVSGTYGAIKMEDGSNITLNSGAVLYAWGYVYGTGTVTANSGAKVYEYLQANDFPGGSNLSTFVDTAPDTDADGDGNPANDYIKSFPLSQYYVQNVEVAMTLHYGAEEHLYATGRVSSFKIGMPVEFVGDEGMFRLSAGSSLTKDYDHTTDRLIVDVNGNATLSSLVLDFSNHALAVAIKAVLGTTKFDSSQYILGLNSNITIHVNSGTTTIGQDVALFPGVEIYIDKGATLYIPSGASTNTTVMGTGGNNVYAYDKENWGNFVFSNVQLMPATYSPTPGRYQRTAADLKDVIIDVNGTITTDGYLYSTVTTDEEFNPVSGGAAIISSGKTGKIVMQNGAGMEMFAYRLDGTSAADDVTTIDSAWLKNGDGTFLLTDGAEAGTTFAYCSTHDKWYTGECEDCAAVPAEYTITWQINGVTYATTKEVAGDPITAPSYTAPEGYDFSGWTYPETMPEGDQTYNATQTIKTFQITWNINGTETTEDFDWNTVPEFKGNIGLPSGPDCYSYAFAGWSTAANGGGTKYPDGTALPAATANATYYAYYTETISHAFNSKASAQQATAADCENAATYYVQCDHCDAVDKTKTVAVGTANGHAFNTKASSQQATAADCNNAATYYVQCDNCDAVHETKTVAVGTANGHAFNTKASSQQATAADCNNAATYYVQCDNCDAVHESKTVAVGTANGHAFNTKASSQQATAADCNNAATYYVQCDNCDAVHESKTVAVGTANGHAFNTKASSQQATAADCNNAATYYVQCDNCDAVHESKTVEVGTANGHAFNTKASSQQATAADCNNAATYYVQCDNCDAVHESKTVAVGTANGHVYDNDCDTTCNVCQAIREVGDHVYENACDADCDICGATRTPADHIGGTATCTAKAVCEECGKEYGDVDPANHASDAVTYVNIVDDTHTVKHTCCNTEETPVAHKYDETTHVCVCGKVEEFTIEWFINGDKTVVATYAYGATVNGFTPETVYEKYGKFEFGAWHDYSTDELVELPIAMPAENLKLYASWYFTGWVVVANARYYQVQNVEVSGWFCVNDENELVEDGNGKMYYANPKNFVVVNDITKIEDVLYAFDHETGAFLSDYTGIYTASNGDIYYVENGIAVANKGLVRIYENGEAKYYYFGCSITDKDSHEDNVCDAYKAQKDTVHWVENTNELLPAWDYTFGADSVIVHDNKLNNNEEQTHAVVDYDNVKYYTIDGIKVHMGLFVGDGEKLGEYGTCYYARSTGELVADREYWVSESHLNGVKYNGIPVKEGMYLFDEEGRMICSTGIKEEDGSLFYYVNGLRDYAGLIKSGEQYYYVRTSGELVVNCTYWITKTNGLMPEGAYTFDENGVMMDPKLLPTVDENTTGIVDGFYYEKGVITYAGLIEYQGAYYYIRSNGEMVRDCTYWITKTNGLADSASYKFDADGKMILGNGIVEEDGKLVYYKNGQRNYAGLIKIDGYWYYVRTNGELVVDCSYWITKTNGEPVSKRQYTFNELGQIIDCDFE